jgi:hypothetical protein
VKLIKISSSCFLIDRDHIATMNEICSETALPQILKNAPKPQEKAGITDIRTFQAIAANNHESVPVA